MSGVVKEVQLKCLAFSKVVLGVESATLPDQVTGWLAGWPTGWLTSSLAGGECGV